MNKPKNSLTLKKENIFFRFRFELLIFFFLTLQFVIFLPQKRWISPLVIVEYIKSYEFGFAPKMLLGSVVRLFTEYFTIDMFMIVAEVSYAAMVVTVSLLLGGILRKADTETTDTAIIFSVLFLVSPFGIKYLLGTYIGRVDVYWIIFTLISLKLVRSKIWRWTIPLFCFVMMAVHHGYVTTYMPALAIPVLYDAYKEKGKKSTVIFAVVTYGILASTFLYFQFYKNNLPFSGAEEYTAYLSQKTDAIISTTQIYLDYYVGSLKNLLDFSIPSVSVFAVKFLCLYLFMNLPLIIVFLTLWIKSMKKSDDKFKKFIFLVSALAPLVFIPSAILGVDWDRWLASVINTQFIVIFYFIAVRETAVVSAAKEISAFFRKNIFLLIFAVMFMSTLSYSTASFMFFKMIDGKPHAEFFDKVLKNYTPFSQNAIGTYYM